MRNGVIVRIEFLRPARRPQRSPVVDYVAYFKAESYMSAQTLIASLDPAKARGIVV